MDLIRIKLDEEHQIELTKNLLPYNLDLIQLSTVDLSLYSFLQQYVPNSCDHNVRQRSMVLIFRAFLDGNKPVDIREHNKTIYLSVNQNQK